MKHLEKEGLYCDYCDCVMTNGYHEHGESVWCDDCEEDGKDNTKNETIDKVIKDISYLHSKVNWGTSFLDAKAVQIMYEWAKDIRKLIQN